MKNIFRMLVLTVVFCNVFLVSAKVRYEEKNGKIFCIIDYKDDSVAAMNCIGSMTGNWKEPGEPMYKNAEGRWEYKFEMLRGKEFYKFFDPTKSGEAAYFEDPEAPEEVANPFGSKNGVLRKPKLGAVGGADAPVEEEYPKLNFGMWSRTTYNMFFGSQLSQKVTYTSAGDVDTGTEKVLSRGGVQVDMPATGYFVADPNISHRWEGENGTTAGNATRVWLDQTRLRSSNTFKVHGMVFKHMQLDTEINFNGTVITGYDDYWAASSADARQTAFNTIQRNAASQYMGLVFGPFASNGAWGRWVGERTNTWDNNPDNNTIWIDQIVISFPFDDFEAKVGILGNNGAKSKDPMSLLSGKRTGWKEDVATNLEFYVHPKKVKNLNVLIGAAHTWRDMTLEKGKGEVWYSGNRVDNSDRKYYTYLNADYKVGMAEFGAMWYFNSWSISALDMFANGEMTIAPWIRLKPIKGLTIEAELSTNLSTIYLDTVSSNDNFYDYTTYRTAKEKFDIFANSAVLANVTYVMPNLFNFGVSLKAAGTTYKGVLGDEDAQFSGWCDSDRRVNGITNYSVGANPYHNNDKGASILTAVDFSVTPLKTKLLKIGTKEEIVIGKMDSLLAEGTEYSDTNTTGTQKNKRQIDLVSSPYVEVNYKNINFNLGVVFSYTNYQDDTLLIDNKKVVDSTNLFTFNELLLTASISDISSVLKSVELDYRVGFEYYNGFYESVSSKTTWASLKDSIQTKLMHNEIIANFYFAKDIQLGAGLIVRNYFGDQADTVLNKLSASMIDNLKESDVEYLSTGAEIRGEDGNFVFTKSDLKKAYWTARTDSWNIGGALQFKYKVPVEFLQFPTFFVNLGLGWNPFDDDGQTTANWFKTKDALGNNSWNKDNTGVSEETSVFTIGMQWDF